MRRTILIADDSSTIRRVVEHTFAETDVHVVLATDGIEALAIARTECLDVALVDVLMPRMTGYEVAETLARDVATAGIPVILLSGAFEPFDEDRAASCGALGHLSKPFEGSTLLAKVEEVFSRYPPARKIEVQRRGAGPRDAEVLGELAGEVHAESSSGEEVEQPLGKLTLEDQCIPAPHLVTNEEEQILTSEGRPAGQSPESWIEQAVPLPGEEGFDLGPLAIESSTLGGSDVVREEVRRVVSELAPEILREVAWEVLPDLLERLIRETAPRSGEESGDSES